MKAIHIIIIDTILFWWKSQNLMKILFDKMYLIWKNEMPTYYCIRFIISFFPNITKYTHVFVYFWTKFANLYHWHYGPHRPSILCSSFYTTFLRKKNPRQFPREQPWEIITEQGDVWRILQHCIIFSAFLLTECCSEINSK